jgi:hypothetical protein
MRNKAVLHRTGMDGAYSSCASPCSGLQTPPSPCLDHCAYSPQPRPRTDSDKEDAWIARWTATDS